MNDYIKQLTFFYFIAIALSTWNVLHGLGKPMGLVSVFCLFLNIYSAYRFLRQ